MKYAFLLAALFAMPVMACEINLPNHVIFLGEQNPQQTYLQSNCSPESTLEVHEAVMNMDGNVGAYQLNEIMTQRGFPGITFSPQMIKIQHLKNIIREQLLLPAGVHVKTTRSVNTNNVLALSAGDQLEVSCNTCLFGTYQPINLTVKGFDGNRRSLMASADFSKMVRAFRITQPLPSFSEITDKNVLKEEYVEAIPHTDLITDFDSLKYYKTNKPLRTGELLKRSDLNAVNLVKAGLKTEVIIESSQIRIKTDGISRNSGAIGEMVEVYHAQKNKKYLGKVIDVNRVLVEL
jgi:flagella basal body P-ring formation protein FlgA